MPNRAATTLSPGDSVLDSAASQAPVPLAGKMNGWPLTVLKIFFRSSKAGPASEGKSEDRWSSMARCMARRTRSGTLVGPGTKRKLRPDIWDLLLGNVGVGSREQPGFRGALHWFDLELDPTQ